MVPKESADEQTRSSWAKPIASYDAVPAVYKDFFGPLQADGREFPYTVLTPSYEGFIHRTTEKLVCDFGHEIYVLERSRNTFEAQCYPFERISYIEFRTVLLDAYIKISGVTKYGVAASSIFRFNSVTDYLFTPILERIRLATVDSKGAAQNSELEKFDHLVRLNYKFMNYARRSLLGGEKVIHSVLQPEIRVSLLTVLGKTYYRTISPTHMSILTDRELIMLREEERRSGNERYGGVWDYIPLNKIVTLSLSEKDSSLLVFSIQLPENARLEYLFQASAKREVNQLLDRFRELTTQSPPGAFH
jgi:hypothetical protein